MTGAPVLRAEPLQSVHEGALAEVPRTNPEQER